MKTINPLVIQKLASHVDKKGFASLLNYLNGLQQRALYIKCAFVLVSGAIMAAVVFAISVLGHLETTDRTDLLKGAFAVSIALMVFLKPEIPKVDNEKVQSLVNQKLTVDILNILNGDLRREIETFERYFVLTAALCSFFLLVYTVLK
jgi:hypothetical protein